VRARRRGRRGGNHEELSSGRRSFLLYTIREVGRRRLALCPDWAGTPRWFILDVVVKCTILALEWSQQTHSQASEPESAQPSLQRTPVWQHARCYENEKASRTFRSTSRHEHERNVVRTLATEYRPNLPSLSLGFPASATAFSISSR
jgi:hypothetical protein